MTYKQKNCIRCGKNLGVVYANVRFCSKCFKENRAKYRREYYKRPKVRKKQNEYLKKYMREYIKNPKIKKYRREYAKKYRLKNLEKIKKYQKKYFDNLRKKNGK